MLALLCTQSCFLLGAEEGLTVEKADPFKAFGIDLDLKNREVRVAATICCTQGVLEYAVCLPDTFDHEALFSTKCKPSILHVCLLALGLEPRSPDGLEELLRGEQKQKKFSLNIEVEYEQDGQKTRRPISDFMRYRNQENKAPSSLWVFTGSFFGSRNDKPVYAADVHGGLVGLGQDSTSVLQFGEDAGNPYDNEDQGLEINTKTVPEKGTKVQLIFAPPQSKPEKSEDPVAPQK